jgi:hypothetical protein
LLAMSFWSLDYLLVARESLVVYVLFQHDLSMCFT